MLSPESFTRTRKRHVTDVVRVALERHGVLGFIETHEAMTLLEARQLIWENVEHAPCDFQFVLDDGVPVSARQETTQRVLQFFPCLKIREGKRPASLAVTATATSVISTPQDNSAVVSSNGSTEKISVWTASGDEFTVWISEDYTFQQLRRDAARYWNFPASHVALTDRDGCLWPEQAKILAVMNVDELLERKIVLEYKAGACAAASIITTTGKPRSTATLARTLAVVPSRRRSLLGDTTLSPARSITNWHDTLPSTQVLNPVEELWRIFTFYCVNGDSLDLECIRAHQFNRLLRDARVLGTAVTPAMVDIIYTSETKGKPQASGKMNFDEFLNALVKVARAHHRKGSHKILQKNTDTTEEDVLFQRLVSECILPRASRWPTHAWELQTQQLRTPEIVRLVAKFLDPLLDLFAFYAKSHVLHAAAGAKQFHMAYADYQRFVNDFAMASLQISSVEAAQVFVAACTSVPVHEALSGDESERERLMSPRSPTTTEAHDDCDVRSCTSSFSSSSSSSSGMTPTSAFQKLAQSADGSVLFLPAAAQVGRLCMSFSAFLDALGRLGLVAFAKTKTGKLHALQSVKAVFHHVSRGLTRSRVLDIVATHGSASIHAGRFYAGSVAFSNRFLDMWRYEGSPDYLAVGVAAVDLVGDPAATIPLSPVVGGKKAVETTTTTPLSPSRRLTSSAALFDERVVPNGAGRGREALDRLVRNAFIRNAVQAATAATAAVEDLIDNDKVDRITPAQLTNEVMVSQPPPAPLEHEPHQRAAEVASSPASPTVDVQQIGTADALTATQPVLLRSYLSGGVRLHSHDERTLFESILLKGGVFKKYGQWGNPHRRFVWCTPAFDGVYWRPINKKHSLTKEKDGIAVTSLVAVLPGHSQRTRYAFMKHLSEEKSLSRCFSLVAEDRRLDLEADSEASRDLWMQALQFLIRSRLPTG